MRDLRGGAEVPGLGRVLVVVPTYCERESLPGLLAGVRAAVPQAAVLVVDDASPDGTGDAADAAAAADPCISVLHRIEKDGLGRAYVAGFAEGLAAGADVLVEMDADGSHRPTDLPRVLGALIASPDGTGGPADVVIGSRWVPGGQVVGWPRHREALSRGGNAYVRLALRIPVVDATAGFRAYRGPLLRRLALGDVSSRGYCFQVDLTRRALAAGALVREVPVTFVEREQGASKMTGGIVAEALWRVTAWGLQARLRRGPGAGED